MILAKDAWPVLAGAAAMCLLAAAWLLALGGRTRRRKGAEGEGMRSATQARHPGYGARTLAALRRPALAAFSAFTVSAALDGIAALLPPESPVQALRDCAEPRDAGDGIASCDAAPDLRPRI